MSIEIGEHQANEVVVRKCTLCSSHAIYDTVCPSCKINVAKEKENLESFCDIPPFLENKFNDIFGVY